MAYDRFKPNELILRDELALDRTQMANERTLLSYVRTAIMLVISGGTLLKLFGSDFPNLIAAWSIIGLGLLVAGWGGWRFRRVRHHLSDIVPSDTDP